MTRPPASGDLAAAPGYGPEPQYPIDSVDKALLVLLLLRDHDELRLTDVSRYLGVASSTAHRLLSMLHYRGLVQQDPASRTYHSGPVLDELAFGVMNRLDVRAAARPVLEYLNAQVMETLHLGLLEGTDVRFIDAIESPRALRVASRVGRMMPGPLHLYRQGAACPAHRGRDLQSVPGGKTPAADAALHRYQSRAAPRARGRPPGRIRGQPGGERRRRWLAGDRRGVRPSRGCRDQRVRTAEQDVGRPASRDPGGAAAVSRKPGRPAAVRLRLGRQPDR